MRRLIFSINPGRSGSEYLARILGTADGVHAVHEPLPDGAGRFIKLFPARRLTLLDLLVYPPLYLRKYMKVAAIRRTLRTLPVDGVYAETNHMFIMSFYDVVMNHFGGVNVVLLRRWLPAAVKSFIELDHFTPQCPFTKYWYASPNARSSAGLAPAPDRSLDQEERIIGYLIDIEARAQRFIAKYPDTRVVPIRLEELNDLDRVRALFAALDVRETPRTRETVGRVVNAKLGHKQRVARSVTIEYCQERVVRYLERCAQAGITLPALPQLEEVPDGRGGRGPSASRQA